MQDLVVKYLFSLLHTEIHSNQVFLLVVCCSLLAFSLSWP